MLPQRFSSRLSVFILFVIVVFLVSCDKNEGPLLPTAEYYFFGKVDNRQILVEEKGNIEFIGGLSHSASVGDECYGGYKSGLYRVSDSGGTRLTFQITFYNVVYSEGPCSETTLYDIFFSQLNPGNYEISWIGEGITVGLHYYDKNGESWSSIHGDQDEQSFFTVEETEFLGVNESGQKLQKVAGKFSGYLYQYDSETETVTDSIFISDAEFVFKFISE